MVDRHSGGSYHWEESRRERGKPLTLEDLVKLVQRAQQRGVPLTAEVTTRRLGLRRRVRRIKVGRDADSPSASTDTGGIPIVTE